METPIRVAILEDHPLLVQGYLCRLNECSNMQVVGTTGYGEEIEKMLARSPVDVLILDVSVPVSKDNKSMYPILVVIPDLLQVYPALEILIVSMHNHPTLIHAIMKAGASGFILKDDSYFLEAMPEIIHLIAEGGFYLSPAARKQYLNRRDTDLPLSARQLQALSLCAAYPEASTTHLAGKMKVAASTIRNLLSGAYMHLEVHSRSAAVAKARQLGMLPPENAVINMEDLTRT